MTRENKLALVVGFGLILFVGILISDHFSTARHQDVAALQRPDDPVLLASSPGLIDIEAAPRDASPPPSGARPRDEDATRPRARRAADVVATPRDAGALHIEMGKDVRRPDSARTGNRTDDRPWRFHTVTAGETLTEVCRTHYGDGSLAAALARYNDIDDPDTVGVGRTLRLPEPSVLGGRTTSAPARESRRAPADAKPPADASPQYTTYTVKPGDVLSKIAARFLGSGSQWRELYELNRDVIDDPDNVVVGTVLKIPR